jgi:hypothetical protein
MLRYTTILQIFTITLISIVYGALGFLYSFFGLLGQSSNIIILEPFRLITLQELGGHFLFGAIVGVPSRNIKIILLAGLMAVTIDSDHLLNIAGFHIQGRPDHSILFAFLSSIVMGLLGKRIYHKVSRGNTLDRSRRYEKVDENNKNNTSNTKSIDNNNNNNNNKQFSSLLIITLAAFLSHIAYDTFVDNKAVFPLFVPFSFNQIIIPKMYSLPIEAAGFILVYLYYNSNTLSHHYSIFTSKKKKITTTTTRTSKKNKRC